MPLVTTLVMRALLIAAGLLFAASLGLVLALLFCIWCIRAAWSRLTGRPVAPFIIRIDPRSGFDRMARRARQPGPTPRADAVRPARARGDVTDVEPRPPAR